MIARPTKKQLTNKPRERRGVRRTSHARRELCELKRRGASRSYHRFDDRECDEGETTWNASKGAKRRDDNDDDVDKSTKGAPRKQRMLREHAYKGHDCHIAVDTAMTIRRRL
jgi:hypothetical protein